MTELIPLDAATVELIETNAELVRTMGQNLGVTLNYDEQAVEWLADHIERIRQYSFSPDQLENFVSIYGSFLGECIRNEYGGFWGEGEGLRGLVLENAILVNPGGKVRKQFEQGKEEGESVYGLFAVIADRYPHLRKKKDLP